MAQFTKISPKTCTIISVDCKQHSIFVIFCFEHQLYSLANNRTSRDTLTNTNGFESDSDIDLLAPQNWLPTSGLRISYVMWLNGAWLNDHVKLYYRIVSYRIRSDAEADGLTRSVWLRQAVGLSVFIFWKICVYVRYNVFYNFYYIAYAYPGTLVYLSL